MKRHLIIKAILVLGLLGFVGTAVGQAKHHREVRLEKRIELQSREAQLIELNNRYEGVLKQKTDTEKERQEQAEKIRELEAERERLSAELQAKLDRKAREEEKLARANPVRTQRVYAAGSCEDWIAAAGITDKVNARELIRRESNCNPHAINPSSGACGVAQELPCGKSGCSLGDGACQVKWMNSYTLSRYGSWANAVAFHNANSWY